MASKVVLRSFHAGVVLKPSPSKEVESKQIVLLPNKRRFLPIRASEAKSTNIAEAENSKTNSQRILDKKHKSTFPNGFEMLLHDVCDETNVAEIKFKVGDFELHLKRDARSPKVSLPASPLIESSTTVPLVPSKPKIETATVSPPVVKEKSTPPDTTPFINVSAEKTSKIAALDASGPNAYVLVSSPTVGVFRKARTLKGKKQPPSCKEGDIIKEGQIIGFLEQFGNELPVRSDVSGEVLKVLYRDEEAVGYGDPLVAVLPSFHGIK